MLPGELALVQMRAQDRREQPGPDDVVAPAGARPSGTPRRTALRPRPTRPAICGVSEEVAQVSITSGSPANPPGWPRWWLSYPGGTSVEGSTGRSCSRAGIGWPCSTCPASSIGYQTGNGTPKKRWRLMHQSPLSPWTQSSKRALMYGGVPLELAARSISSSRWSIVRMNHCRLVTISTGRSPFSKNLTRVSRAGARRSGRRTRRASRPSAGAPG